MSSCTIMDAPVHDTDLHSRLSPVYIPLEDLRFFAQQFADPGNISRPRRPRPWRWLCGHGDGDGANRQTRGVGHGAANGFELDLM